MKRRNFLALFGAAIAMPFIKATSMLGKNKYLISKDDEHLGTAHAYQMLYDEHWSHIGSGTDEDGNRVYYKL